MTIEEQLKKIILDRYKSVRAFTQDIGIPYSTVDTMFKRGIYGTGVSTILKLFQALELDVESISTGELKPKTKNAPTTESSESDVQKKRLMGNYDKMNSFGKERLVEHSDEMLCIEKYTEVSTKPSSKKEA